VFVIAKKMLRIRSLIVRTLMLFFGGTADSHALC
jgi:hypothetical protein